jgi:hypothetical protein
MEVRQTNIYEFYYRFFKHFLTSFLDKPSHMSILYSTSVLTESEAFLESKTDDKIFYLTVSFFFVPLVCDECRKSITSKSIVAVSISITYLTNLERQILYSIF